MPPDGADPHPRIGAALKEERERQGLKLEDLEARTKIRTRYLRALENEEWDILPGPAYVRGFLRTYADTLGLDGEAIVDDYREEFESPDAPRRGLPEAVLTEHREARSPRSNRRWLIAGLLVGLVALLLVLGLWDRSDDDDGRDGRGKAAREKQDGKGGGGGGESGSEADQPEDVPEIVELELTPQTDSEVCLVNKAGAVLIDNQVLNPGDEERFEAEAFDLSLGFGDVQLSLNGDEQRVKASSDSPVTYRVTPQGLRQPVPDADPECP